MKVKIFRFCQWLRLTRLGHWLELDHSPSLSMIGRCPCKACNQHDFIADFERGWTETETELRR